MSIPVWGSPITTYVPPSTRTRKSDKVAGLSPIGQSGLTIAIDLGTTCSGVVYGSPSHTNGQVRFVLNWPGSIDTYRKIPTCIVLGENQQTLSWGLEAEATPSDNAFRIDLFKLFLDPEQYRTQHRQDQLLPSLPDGESPVSVIAGFLSLFWSHAKQEITKDLQGANESLLETSRVWLIVPSTWNREGIELMRQAADSLDLGGYGQENRFTIMTDAEAASMQVYMEQESKLKFSMPSKRGSFLVCDIGGIALKTTAFKYKDFTDIPALNISQIAARMATNCGSILLDERFGALMKTLMEQHPIHRDAASKAYFMHQFRGREKLQYKGETEDNEFFDFTCFNTGDLDDPSVGLENGVVSIPGILLRREVFDPVVNKVLESMRQHMRELAPGGTPQTIFLVGGFAENPYLFSKIKQNFKDLSGTSIYRPLDADTAVLRGAANFGITGRPLESKIYVPDSYAMKVKLPAEPVDWTMRPTFIKDNGAGVLVCEKRLQYLLFSGSVPKGRMERTKCTKLSKNSKDAIFRARIFKHRGRHEIKRYADEEGLEEVCLWQVDLMTLHHFKFAPEGSDERFYTEFELGLEVDSTALYGILLYGGSEVARFASIFLRRHKYLTCNDPAEPL